MRRMSIFLLIGIVAMLAWPVEASVVPTTKAEVEVTVQGLNGLLKCSGCVNTCDPTPLYADQDVLVGMVTVDWHADGNVYVTYEMTEDLWYMTEVHVGWFDCDDLPKKMIPGKAQIGVEDLEQLGRDFDLTRRPVELLNVPDQGYHVRRYFLEHNRIRAVIGSGYTALCHQ